MFTKGCSMPGGPTVDQLSRSAAAVRRARRDRGLPQEQLAEVAGLHS